MITHQETFDFINELENTFIKKDSIDINDEESVDLYYMNRLFQHNSVFRLYILTAFCLYMDTIMDQDGKPVTRDKQIQRCIKLIDGMITETVSKDMLNRMLLHSTFASERIAPNQKV